MKNYFVGLTGASGHAYAEMLIRELIDAGHRVDLSITASGAKVLRHERGIDAGVAGETLAVSLDRWLGTGASERVRVFEAECIEAPPSSGTHLSGGAVICPCSMGTLARVAVGLSGNLVERAADVSLKEGRPLILVPRETPLGEIHLENMLRLARRGAVILPAMPGFYHGPESIDDLVRHVVSKILDRLGVERGGGVRWSGLAEEPEGDPDLGGPPPEAIP